MTDSSAAGRVDGNGVQVDQQVVRLEENTMTYEALTQAAGHPRARLLQARLALAAQEPKKAIDSLEGCWDDPHARRQAHLLAAQAWQRRGDGRRG